MGDIPNTESPKLQDDKLTKVETPDVKVEVNELNASIEAQTEKYFEQKHQ